MEQIHHCKFSLFSLSKNIGSSSLIAKCFIYLDTFDSLEEAKSAQKEIELSTLIIPTY